MERKKKNFRTCVLTSGLVTPAELDQVIVALWTERSGGRSAAQVEIAEQELADRLVAENKLTPYQAKQLLSGLTKLKLGQYRILEPIGHGGMGEVFKAEHTIMGRIVAVKVLPLHKSTPAATASFMHEIRSQARLQHVNLVQAYDAGHDGNVYYLVTEYVPAIDLRKYVRIHGPLTMKAAATIITQAAKGLGHAHEQGLIHRDVKPGNLLVTPEGITKVSDLGLAAWLNDTETDPRAGKIVGTADYLSPEQILTPRQVTAASDVYSLGCTLYYAVTGKVPYTGGGTRDKTRRHLEDMPLHPRRLNPDLSDAFVEVIAAMMDKNVAQRIQTAAEVVRRLAPWAEDRVDTPPAIGNPMERELLPFSSTIPLTEESDGGEPFSALPETDWQLEESLSQGSQATEPFAALSEETIPDKSDYWLAPPRRKWSQDWLLYSAAALAIIVLLMVLIHILFK
ncbi:MAG TPA: serine/threonine-protein kinase [Pirellulales bacterium]|nr:serine/threonine-protein kinase [Pirellulales bacterium]